MLKERFDHLRADGALVHNITNYVTVNDVANVLLACGGSPIMADDIDDAPEITAICGCLLYTSYDIMIPFVLRRCHSAARKRSLNHEL